MSAPSQLPQCIKAIVLMHVAKKSQNTVDNNNLTPALSALCSSWRLSSAQHLSKTQLLLLASRKRYERDLEPGLHSCDPGNSFLPVTFLKPLSYEIFKSLGHVPIHDESLLYRSLGVRRSGCVWVHNAAWGEHREWAGVPPAWAKSNTAHYLTIISKSAGRPKMQDLCVFFVSLGRSSRFLKGWHYYLVLSFLSAQ